MNSALAIEVDELSFRYSKSSPLIECISLKLLSGQTGVVVGQNGVGKSTLFNILLGTLQSTSGSYSIHGLEGSRLGPGLVGSVWQDVSGSLMPWLTLRENIELPLRMKRNKSGGSLVDELVKYAGISIPLAQYPHECSGGERQIASILRALVLEPKVLLLDEPFSNLSYDNTLESVRFLQELQSRMDITMLLICHSLEIAVLLADVIFPLKGRPVAHGVDDGVLIQSELTRPRSQAWMASREFEDQLALIREAVK